MIQWIENHPYLAGSAAVGILIVFILLRRGSSGSAAVATAPGVSDAQIAAGTQLQAMQIQAQAQTAGYQAEQNIYSILTGADIEKTKIQANVYLQDILSSADVSKYQIDAEKAVALAQTGANVDIARLSSQPISPVQVVGQQTVNDLTVAKQQQQQIAIGDVAAYSATTDYTGYQGWLPAPGNAGRPTYYGLQASGAIQVCNQSTVAGQAACAAANQKVLNFYDI